MNRSGFLAKRIMALVLASAMMITCLPLNAYAREGSIDDGNATDVWMEDAVIDDPVEITYADESIPDALYEDVTDADTPEPDDSYDDVNALSVQDPDMSLMIDDLVTDDPIVPLGSGDETPMAEADYELREEGKDKDLTYPLWFDKLYEGYTHTDPINVTFKYFGEGRGNFTISGKEHFFVYNPNGTWYQNGSVHTFEITPAGNLKTGTYADTIRITTDAGEFIEFTVKVTVKPVSVKFRIGESYKNVDLGYIRLGDETTAAGKKKTFTIHNDGNVRLDFALQNSADVVTIDPEEFSVEPGESQTVTVTPRADKKYSGTTSVYIKARPYQNSYGYIDNNITLKLGVGDYLYGNVYASDLVDGAEYMLTAWTTIIIEDGDNAHISSIGNATSGNSLTIKQESGTGTLIIDNGIDIEGHVTIKGGKVQINGGTFGIRSTRGNIEISDSDISINNSQFGIYAYIGDVAISGGNVSVLAPLTAGIVADQALTISKAAVVNVTGSGNFGISSSNGDLTIKNYAYVYAEGSKSGGAGLASDHGNIVIQDFPVVHAIGQWAVFILSDDKTVDIGDGIAKSPSDANLVKSGYVRYEDSHGNNVTDMMFRKSGAGSLSITPGTFAFDTKDYGEDPPENAAVKVQNNSPFTERITKVEVPAGYDVDDVVGSFITHGAVLTVNFGPKAKLAAGDHNGYFKITTEAGTTVTAPVSFKVNTPTASISASPATLNFGTLKVGYAPVAAKTVTIKNTGKSTDPPVNLKDITLADYTATFDKKVISPGQSAVLTIKPKDNLAAGDHSLNDFYVESDEGAFAKINVALKVEEWKYELTGESDKVDLGRMHVGYSTPATRSYTLKNTGEKPLTITECNISNNKLIIKEDIVNTVIAPGKTIKITLTAPEGVSEGSYSTDVTVKAHGEEKDVEWTFGTSYSVEYFIEGKVNASDLVDGQDYKAYGNATINISPGDNVSVSRISGNAGLTITGSSSGFLNTGDLNAAGPIVINGGNIKAIDIYSKTSDITISGDAAVDTDIIYASDGNLTIGGNSIVNANGHEGYGYGLVALKKLTIKDNAYVIARGDEAAVNTYTDYGLDIAPSLEIKEPVNGKIGGPRLTTVVNEDDTAATYVCISSKGGTDGTLTVRYPSLDFGEYSDAELTPEARTVSLINDGAVTLVLNDVTAAGDSFTITQPVKKILRPGETTEFTIRPAEDLIAGSYIGAVKVKSDKTAEETIAPKATVTAAIYGLEFSENGAPIPAAGIDFGTLVVGYEGGRPREVTVKNTGNTKINLNAPERTFAGFRGYDLGELSQTVLLPGESATFTVDVTPVYTAYTEALAKGEIEVTYYADKFKDEEAKWKSGTFPVKYESVDTPKAGDGTHNVLWMMDIPDQTYTGSAIKPVPQVYFGKTLLTSADYTVSYSNNTNAALSTAPKAPTVTIKGKSKYTGTISKTFTIKPLDIAKAYTDTDAMVIAHYTDVHQTIQADNKVHRDTIKMYYNLPNGKKVTLSGKNNKDYELEYKLGDNPADPKEAGVYTITATGRGNYTGTRTLKLRITDKNTVTLLSKVTFPTIPAQKYENSRGNRIILVGAELAGETKALDSKGKPFEWTLTDKTKSPAYALTKGTDYDIFYDNNTDIGIATVTVTGKGSYAGTVTKTFKITGTAMSALKQKDFRASYPYTGTPVRQAMKFYTKAGTELIEGLDYGVTYIDSAKRTLATAPVEIGTYTVVYTGKGYYTGTVKKTYKITGNAMSKVTFPKDFSTSRDYNALYDVKAKAFEYTGEAFEVAGPEAGGDDQGIILTYTYPDKTRETLKKGTDYSVRYTKNTNPGTATIEFIGMGKYTGTVKKTFKISAYSLTNNGARICVYYDERDPLKIWPEAADATKPVYHYLKGGVCPEPIVEYTYNGKTRILEKGKDYTLSYVNNKNTGLATDLKPPTVTIKGKGTFAGSMNRKFNITDAAADDPYTATATNYVLSYNPEDYTASYGDTQAKRFTGMQKLAVPVQTKVTIRDASGALLKEGTDYVKPGQFVYKFATDTDLLQVYDNTEGGINISPCLEGGMLNPSDFGKGKYVTGYYGKCYYIIPPLTRINVEIQGLGKYAAQTFKCQYVYVYADASKTSVTIPDQQYTGRAVTLDERDIKITVKKGQTVTELKPEIDYMILPLTYKNNVELGTAKVDIMFTLNKSQGTALVDGIRTVSFKIVKRQMNYQIKYDNGWGDSEKGLIKALMTKTGLTEQQVKNSYRITGTMKDSLLPLNSKLTANAFKVQKYDDAKKKWTNVDASVISFAGWDTKATGDGTRFADKAQFAPSWLTRLVYGDRYTLYAQWNVN